MTSWQGKDGPAHIDTLDEIGRGRYRITEPIHVDGTWKTTLRLHKGRELAGLPIFMPADPAIPVSQIPVQSQENRTFELDHQLLQREQKKGVAGWLTAGRLPRGRPDLAGPDLRGRLGALEAREPWRGAAG